MPTSLDSYFPFDAGPGANITEDQWRKMARHWLGTGPLLGEDNELLPYGDSSGLQVKVKTGKVWMRGHYGENTTEKTLAIAAVAGIAGGQSRLDRVVLRGDFTNNRVELDVLTGTPAATGSQVAPAVTQSSSSWEVSLATVGPLTNASTTVTAGMVTDTRQVVIGAQAVTTSVPYTPTLGGTGWAIGNGTIVGSYVQIGDLVHVRIKITFGSTSTFGTGGLTISLPVNGTNGGDAGFGWAQDASVAGEKRHLMADIGTSVATLYAMSTVAAVAHRYAAVVDTFPFAWAVSDTISLSLDYEAA